MAENNPITPGGSVPPKPPEASKVQPKKETVRISLPPKPSSAPTIKLPTLPAGGPATPGGATPMSVNPPGATPAPAAPRPPTAGGPAPGAAAPAAIRPPSGTGSTVTRPPAAASPSVPAAPRPAPAPVVRRGVSTVDVGLSVAAAVIGLGAVVSIYLLKTLE